MTILLLLAQVFSGGISASGGVSMSAEVGIAATACSTTTDSQWDNFFWQVIPFGVTAANTQASDGCLPDSAQYPTPSLP